MNAVSRAMTLKDFLDLEFPFHVMVDPDDGGYVIEFPDLPGCMTQIERLSDIAAMAEDARVGWIEAAFEEGVEIPMPSFPETYSGRFNVRLPKSLHRRLVESAARDGVSLNQHVVNLLSEGVALSAVECRLDSIEARINDIPLSDIPICTTETRQRQTSIPDSN